MHATCYAKYRVWGLGLPEVGRAGRGPEAGAAPAAGSNMRSRAAAPHTAAVAASHTETTAAHPVAYTAHKVRHISSLSWIDAHRDIVVKARPAHLL